MTKAFLTSVDLKQNQILNAAWQNLAAAPTSPAPVAGQAYYDTVQLCAFVYNGTTWQPCDASKSTSFPTSANTGFAAGVLNTLLTGLSTASSAVITAASSVLAALGQLQAQISLRAPIASPTFTGTVTSPTGVLVGTGGTALAAGSGLLQATGTGTGSQQFEAQNLSNGTSASTDFIATANDGTDSTYYVDLGINSSTNNDSSFTVAAAHDAYLYAASGNLAIGTATSGKNLTLFAGGTLAANVVATISATSFTATCPVKINLNASATAGSSPTMSGTDFQICGLDGTAARVILDGLGANGVITFRRADGTAVAPSAVASGDTLGTFNAIGYGATGYGNGARVNFGFYAAAAWTDTSQPTYVSLSTTAVGAAAQVERIRLQPSGNISIGTTSDDGINLLQVAGGISSAAPVVDANANAAAPTTGTTVTIATTTAHQIINPSGTLAALTVVSPAAPSLGSTSVQSLDILFTAAITALTWTAGSGTTFGGAAMPGSAAAGACVRLLWVQSIAKWLHTIEV
jgi:hypothetical protein